MNRSISVCRHRTEMPRLPHSLQQLVDEEKQLILLIEENEQDAE